MALEAGSRLGPYEILAPLGAGGMGEVYRARDTKLSRDVAIKVLPPGFTQDQERVARFRREAQLLASLNHSNIASVYGLEESEGTIAIVLELVEGEDLAQRLARGAIPVDEAVAIAKQIADGIEAAHEKGIVHRDLKPANVKLNVDGAVKILDFGLAKAYEGDASTSGLSQSPTLSRQMTEIGVILGTAAYMSPEQARGKPVDKRADIWSFGVVLFEMLTGRRLFTGETVSDTLAAVLKNEPDWRLLPSGLSPAVERLLRRCLDRDPKLRLRDIGEARVVLADPTSSQSGPPSRAADSRHGRTFWIGWSLAATVLAAALAALLLSELHRESSGTELVVRLPFLPPKGEHLAFDHNLRGFAISPDGSLLAYSVEDGATTALRLRSMGSRESAPIRGTEGAMHPFFSPDSKWIGFDAGYKLKKVAVAGGSPVTLCETPAFRGAVWGDDGSIYVVPSMYAPVSRIPDGGGPIRPVTKIRTQEGEQQHRWPEILPGGKVLLYAVGSGADWDEATIVAERLDTGERKILVEGGTSPRYLPSGYLVYARAGALYALPFDAERLEVHGSPVEVADDVLIGTSGCADLDLSRGGILVTAPSGAFTGALMLSFVDREGRGEPVKIAYQPINSTVVLSPDGKRCAIDPGSSVAILDFARLSLLTLKLPARAELPAWSRDGRRLFFGLEKDKYYQIFSKAADDSGDPRLEYPSDAYEEPFEFSADGSQLLSAKILDDGSRELLIHRVTGSPARDEPKILLKSVSFDLAAVFSPDARWVAYQSSESGRPEIYVRPASGEDRKWQVSTEGGGTINGNQAFAWSPDGKEIFYVCGSRFMAAPVSANGNDFVVGTPRVLFENHRILCFDITADGKRFLVAEDPNPGAQTKLDVVVNWSADVRRKVKEAQAP